MSTAATSEGYRPLPVIEVTSSVACGLPWIRPGAFAGVVWVAAPPDHEAEIAGRRPWRDQRPRPQHHLENSAAVHDLQATILHVLGVERYNSRFLYRDLVGVEGEATFWKGQQV